MTQQMRPEYDFLPLAPLLALARLSGPEVAARVGVGRKAAVAWASRGVSVYTADRLALACDLHPAVVWGDEFYSARGARS